MSVEAPLLGSDDEPATSEDALPVPLAESDSLESDSAVSDSLVSDSLVSEEEAALGGPDRGEGPEVFEPDEFEPDEFEPEEFESVVSAKATAGSEAIAMPTPSATASAPTRPTCLE